MARQAQKQCEVSAGGPASRNESLGIDSVINGMSQNEVQCCVAILNLGWESDLRADAIINAGNAITVPDDIFDVVPFLDSHHPGAAMYPEDERERLIPLVLAEVKIEVLSRCRVGDVWNVPYYRASP